MNAYGSQIWAFNKNCLNKFYVAWRKAIRRIWKLPYRTHNNLLHLINLCLPIDVTLDNDNDNDNDNSLLNINVVIK